MLWFVQNFLSPFITTAVQKNENKRIELKKKETQTSVIELIQKTSETKKKF
jgi:hypothetical protein